MDNYPIEEARKVGVACDELYPPTNPVVLARAAASLLASHDRAQEKSDRSMGKRVVEWLAYLMAIE